MTSELPDVIRNLTLQAEGDEICFDPGFLLARAYVFYRLK
jgi:hypothetical protein